MRDWPAGLCPGLLWSSLGDGPGEGDGEDHEGRSETGSTDDGRARPGHPECCQGGHLIPSHVRVRVAVGERRWPELDQSTLQKSTWTTGMRVRPWWYQAWSTATMRMKK